MDYRGYIVRPLGTFPMLTIHSKGSGALPLALRGDFTDIREAHHAIDAYLDSLKKGGRNGKAKDAGTD